MKMIAFCFDTEYTVAALRYKPEGRRFALGWDNWSFSLTYSFRPQYDSGIDSACEQIPVLEIFFVG